MDISLMIDDFKFNYRVATIIRNNNKILLHKSKEDNFYALPGGRVKSGEDSITALKREFLEEIQANIHINKMIGIVENFFKYNEKKYHELMMVYDAEFDKDAEFFNTEIIKGIEENGKIEFIWMNIDKIKELDVRPKNIKDLLINPQNSFVHIIDRPKLN